MALTLASAGIIGLAGWATADSHCPTDPQAEGGYGQPSPPVDWHGCNLSNLALTYVNLTGTDLTGADLSNTNLFGASLQFAKVGGVNLAGARFDGGTLLGATGIPANPNATYNGTRCPDGFDTGWGWPPETPPDTCVGHFLPELVDADSDGVADAIGTGVAGGFNDGTGTSGSIIARGGLDVLVEDTSPGGVRITTVGTGGPASILVCGFTLNLSAGSDATVTCGSVSVVVTEGETTVELSGSDAVIIRQGGGATVDLLPDGTVSVDNFGSTPVDVKFGGLTYSVPTHTAQVFSPDADNDGIPDIADVCPGSVLPDAPTVGLTGARFAARSDGSFNSGMPTLAGLYTLADTKGCSGTQIIQLQGLGVGHTKFGISRGELLKFIAYLNLS